MPKTNRASLSGLENKVMRVIWQHGQATAEVVRTALAATGILKDSTVRTILRRLEQKGYVSHQAEGRTYVYTPTVAPGSVAADAVRAIIQRFCNGSVEDLILGMVDREVVSADTLHELAQRIAADEKSSGRTTKSKRIRSQRSRKG
jgi:BlaI family transcriptional regulator, penicillinase repressor